MKMMRLFLLAALVVCAGCATKEMKSTPFYTGSSVTFSGPVEDRVNLWPLAYYREPVGSVVWPILSFSDDQFAVRPLYSQYRQDGKDGRYDEFNVVWPFAQADLKKDEYRVLPFFWGDDYFTIFPELWWTDKSFVLLPFGMKKDLSFVTVLPLFFGDFVGNQRFNTLLPLYSWDQTAWPGGEDGPIIHEKFWALAGLAGYQLSDTRTDQKRKAHVQDGLRFTSHWFLPFYAKTQSSFYTIPYSRVGYTGYQSDSGRVSAGASLWFLGLAGDSPASSWFWPFYYRDATTLWTPLYGKTPTSDWLLPVYYRGQNSFLTPFYGENGEYEWLLPLYWSDKWDIYSLLYCEHRNESDEIASVFVPPLLSGYRHDARDGDAWRILLGLGGANYPSDGSAETWLLPFYYYASNGTFVTPLFGRTPNADWILPLYYHDDDLFCALGLYGARGDASWLLPLYYKNGDTFLTPLGGGTPDSHWILPLYYKHGDDFVSLAYSRKKLWKGQTRHAVPWLLSEAQTDADGNLTDVQALIALGGWSAEKASAREQSWILPLYGWEKGRSFVSLPYGYWGGGTSQTNTWWATPLVGTRAGAKTGGWIAPLWDLSNDADYDTYAALVKDDMLPNWIRFGTETVTNITYHAESQQRFGLLAESTYAVRTGLDGRADRSAFDVDVSHTAGIEILAESETHDVARFDTKTRRRTGTRTSTTLNGLVNLLVGWTAVEDKLSSNPKEWRTWWKARLLALLYSGSGRTSGDGKASGSANVLGILYNGEWSEKGAEHSILWRVWHREEKDGNVSIDLFPGFTYDAHTDGYKKTSFLWRLWRDEIDPKKGESMDVLFIPIKRPGERK